MIAIFSFLKPYVSWTVSEKTISLLYVLTQAHITTHDRDNDSNIMKFISLGSCVFTLWCHLNYSIDNLYFCLQNFWCLGSLSDCPQVVTISALFITKISSGSSATFFFLICEVSVQFFVSSSKNCYENFTVSINCFFKRLYEVFPIFFQVFLCLLVVFFPISLKLFQRNLLKFSRITTSIWNYFSFFQ